MKTWCVIATLLAGCGGGLESTSGGDDSGGAPGDSSGQAGGDAGVLTAGEIDDNKNLDLFVAELDDTFAKMAGQASIPLADRVLVSVRDSQSRPVSGAIVTVQRGETPLVVPTGTDGRVVLLPGHDGFNPEGARLEISAGGQTYTTTAPSSHEWTITMPEVSGSLPQALDLAFVVDATGSMSDEISYLQAEVEAIAARVSERYGDASLRFALIVYRDEGDEYVTRTFDFSATLGTFVADLDKQSASGGGDYPEAAEVAMADALQLGWRDGNVARVVFHIADAPPHEPGYKPFLTTSLAMRDRGIRVFPIAASGAAIEAEYLMRMSALVTLGRYLFLTDHSGVGNPHEDPHIPCYQVQHLDDLLARTIASELAGTYLPAPADEVIETVGFYRDGVCLPDDPQTAHSEHDRLADR